MKRVVVGLLVATGLLAACSSKAADPPTGARNTTIAGHKAVEVGKQGAPAVVMIHGMSTHKDSWFDLMPRLAAAGYWGIAYDYDPSKSADVGEIVTYARSRGANKVVLAGSSLGAEKALEAADGTRADAVVNFSAEVEKPIKENLLAIASEGDGNTAEYAKHNVDTAGPESKVQIVDGSTHGIDLIHPHPETMKTVTDWLDSVLTGSASG